MGRGRPGDSARGGHANARRSDAARGTRRARDEDSLATLVRAFEGLVARGVGGAELDRWVAHEVRAIGVGQDAATLRALGAVRWGESGGASRGRALTRDVARASAPAAPWAVKSPVGGREARAPGVYALASSGLGGASMQGLDADALGPGVRLEEALSATAFARIAAAFPGLDLGGVTLHQEAEARAQCRRLGAKALAIGTRIAVDAAATGGGTDSPGFLRLVVHELAHVDQARRGQMAGRRGLVAEPGLEAEAWTAASRFEAGMRSASAGGDARTVWERSAEAGREPAAGEGGAVALARGEGARGASTGTGEGAREPRARTVDGLVAEAAVYARDQGLVAVPRLVVAERAVFYDGQERARAAFRVRGPSPEGAGIRVTACTALVDEADRWAAWIEVTPARWREVLADLGRGPSGPASQGSEVVVVIAGAAQSQAAVQAVAATTGPRSEQATSSGTGAGPR